MPYWLSVLQGFSVPILGCITVYIAIRQWRDSRTKMEREHYDRRLKIYQETQKFISSVFTDDKVTIPALFDFQAGVAEADFLFPPEIREFLVNVYKHGAHLHSIQLRYRDFKQSPSPRQRDERVAEEMNEEEEWFQNQPEAARGLFMPYLRLWK